MRSASTTWRLIASVMAVGILVGCLRPGGVLTDAAPPGSDKWAHFVAFALLAFTCSRAGWNSTWVLIAGTVLAIATEFLQAVLPIARTGDILDLACDVAGLIFGRLLACVPHPSIGWSPLRRPTSRG